jgi:wyosine [tRNA(Phe)-imidazoG37] synthetase (radical SAM superfamily)
VKGWNVEEIKAYSELVALGKPDFIEVKVTLELNVPNIVETLLMDTFLIVTA